MKEEEWEILEIKALGTIHMVLVASVAINISKENTTKEKMDTLSKRYENP
jgi:hypothetical protein